MVMSSRRNRRWVRNNRFAIATALVLCYFAFREGRHMGQLNLMPVGNAEGESVVPSHFLLADRVYVDLDRRAAAFYANSKELMVQRFLSFDGLKQAVLSARAAVVKQSATTMGPALAPPAEGAESPPPGVPSPDQPRWPERVDFLIKVPTHFPWLVLGFVWLMPFFASLSNGMLMGMNTASGVAEATAAVKARFRFRTEQTVKVRLADVAGLTEVKQEVTEVIDMLKFPFKYSALGAKVPKGILLDGPPGVGKTLLAKAVAGECGLPFISCSGSEFEEVYVGTGALRIRELFKQARKHRPCVVFIDEIDTFGRKRRSDKNGNSRGTINAFLSEMDGFTESNDIMVLAATNRADVLDEAMTRTGRFDRKISFEKPPHSDRVAIALVHLKKIKLEANLTQAAVAEVLASSLPGATGADIFNVCNEAAIIATRLEKTAVPLECFHMAIDRILLGLEKKAKKLAGTERERLAYHEAGHIVLNWFTSTTDPITKVTIAPRGGSKVGSAATLPQDRYIYTQEMLHERMMVKLGGFLAEEHFFHEVSTNAASDLKDVTQRAYDELCRYGMSPQQVGHFNYVDSLSDSGSYVTVRNPYGEAKGDVIDAEVKRIVHDVKERARQLFMEHLDEVRIIAGKLLKEETLVAKDLWLLLGPRTTTSPEFKKYLEA